LAQNKKNLAISMLLMRNTRSEVVAKAAKDVLALLAVRQIFHPNGVWQGALCVPIFLLLYVL
jgi:hypothetical protein